MPTFCNLTFGVNGIRRSTKTYENSYLRITYIVDDQDNILAYFSKRALEVMYECDFKLSVAEPRLCFRTVEGYPMICLRRTSEEFAFTE